MKTKSLLFLTYWDYRDALIQTYTLPYVRIIQKIVPNNYKIFLVTFESGIKNFDEIKKIKNELLKEGIHWIPLKYYSFGLQALANGIFSFFKLYKICILRKVSSIHAWCTPAGSFGYLLSIFSGKPLIIDSYEPHANAMLENGTWKKKDLSYKILSFFEKKQTLHATALIGTTPQMHEYSKATYKHSLENFYTKPACVDLDAFSIKNKKNKNLLSELQLENKIVLVYAGKFGGIYLDKEVFYFLNVANEYWGERFRVLLLTSHSKEEITNYCIKSKFNQKLIVQRYVSHSEIPSYMGLGDFAITPVKSVPTKKYCSPIKNGEYWALGLPIVITPNISDDSDLIAKNKAGAVLESLDNSGYLKAIKIIDEILKSNSSEEIYNNIRPLAETYRNFEIAESVYKKIYTANE